MAEPFYVITGEHFIDLANVSHARTGTDGSLVLWMKGCPEKLVLNQRIGQPVLQKLREYANPRDLGLERTPDPQMAREMPFGGSAGSFR